MISKILFLTPFVGFATATDCADASDLIATGGCACSDWGSGATNTDGTEYAVNNGGTASAAADECAANKSCFAGYGATSGAKGKGAVCMTPLTTKCANVDASAAIASGCQCGATVATAGNEICFGDETVCITATGGANKLCRQAALNHVVYPVNTHACVKTGGGAVLDGALDLANAQVCKTSDGTRVALASKKVCSHTNDGATGNNGSQLCSFAANDLCLASGAVGTIVAFDMLCLSTEKCFRGSNTANGGADAQAGLAGYSGTPACHATAPAAGDTECAVGVWAAPGTWCRAVGKADKWCAHGWSSTLAAGCVQSGTAICAFRKKAAVGGTGCICVNPGEKVTTARNACQATEFCLTSELTNYYGDATCKAPASGTALADALSAVTACAAADTHGNSTIAAASKTGAATACKCGTAYCGPGTRCLSAQNACLTADIAACATAEKDGLTAGTAAGCTCGTTTCGTGKFCLHDATASISQCTTAAVANCTTTDGSTVTGAVCKCQATAVKNCKATEFCDTTGTTQATTCLAAAKTDAPTAAPTASGSSPISPVIAFAVTMLSLALSALL